MSAVIAPRARTPGSVPATRPSARAMPRDILRDASRRLGVFSLLAGVLWVVATTLGHVDTWIMTDGRVPIISGDFSDLIALASALLSFALYAYTRRTRRDPQFVLDLGLGYMIVTALALALMFHWSPPPPDIPIFPQMSWAGAAILMFAAIVPNSPWKVFIASVIAAAMNPLAMLLARAQGTWHFEPAGLVLIMHYPDFLLAGVAVVISQVVTKLGREVGRAREMGSYRLGDLIGRGGMGEVYRANHRMLARPAAIKLIRPEMLGPLNDDATQLALKRFRREAESAASLRSPHTVEIYDLGETDDGTLYFVMELLDGMDLERLVRDFGPIPASRAIHILRQVCESLAEAHAIGLVHRDVKPANIYVGRVGLRHDFVKVLDFGLVKPTATRAEKDTLTTAEGLTPGTPAYMAPELALGEAVDGRADVYALGCVAHFLLTGRLVFEAETALQMIARHIQSQPDPPSRRAPGPVPPALDALVIDCLAKDPAERSDALGLGRRLEDVAPRGWDEAAAIEWWSGAGVASRSVELGTADAFSPVARHGGAPSGGST